MTMTAPHCASRGLRQTQRYAHLWLDRSVWFLSSADVKAAPAHSSLELSLAPLHAVHDTSYYSSVDEADS